MSDPQAGVLQDVGGAALKASPAFVMYGLTLNEWVAVATIAYLSLQGAYLLWKWAGEWRARRAGQLRERGADA